jgi:hypothetical protein
LVPITLNGWTYDVVEALCAAGRSESDRHDFKFNVAELKDAPKICCAFANTSGGFIVMGVREKERRQFEIVGLDPDKELYGNFLDKVRVDPDIAIPSPKTISVPNSAKLLYVLEIPQSSRRPHLPSTTDKRVFWKRQGSRCVQMTLEEIRYQMNTYEEKREKLALLLIDLQHKLRSLEIQANLADGQYVGDVFSFDIINRVVVEAFSILKEDINTIGALDKLSGQLMSLNTEKQKMLGRLNPNDYSWEFAKAQIDAYRQMVKGALPGITIYVEQIERLFKEKFGIVNPYKVQG